MTSVVLSSASDHQRDSAQSDTRVNPTEGGVDEPRSAIAAVESGHAFIPLWTLAIVLGFSVALLPASVLALSEKEAATVVRLLESLRDEFGNFSYDEGVAEDWFEQDADSHGLIAAAGFTRETWKRALGETYRGFLANVPEAEVLKTFADARRRLEGTKSLTPEQKKLIRQTTDEKEKEILKLRAEGKAFAKAVQPLAERIRTLSNQVANDE